MFIIDVLLKDDFTTAQPELMIFNYFLRALVKAYYEEVTKAHLWTYEKVVDNSLM
tara:strand:+ start:780 stop:944 length:165 start_codon:yes stop_codon:yes gene_type:complete